MTTEDTNNQDATGMNGHNSEAGEGDEQLKAKIDQLQAELDESKDKYLRTLAEMDNLRKRFSKERTDLIKYNCESLLFDLLPVIDSFEQASAESEQAGLTEQDSKFLQGLNLVKKQFFAVLEKNGLKPIDARGQTFDPNIHQAIQRVDTQDVEEETVQTEFARGYMYHDKLLRPSVVSVAVPAQS